MRNYHNITFVLPRTKHTISFPRQARTTITTLFPPGIHEATNVSSALEDHVHTMLDSTLPSPQVFRHFSYTVKEGRLNLSVYRTSLMSNERVRRYHEEEKHILDLLQLGGNLLVLRDDLRAGTIAIMEAGSQMTQEFYTRGMWLQQYYLRETGSITRDQLAYWLEEHQEYKDVEPPLTIDYAPLHAN